jgi:hypothetical protein
MPVEEERSPVERVLAGRVELAEIDRTVSRRSRQTPRSVEAYLNASGPPRWMARLREIDRGIANEKRRIERVYRALHDQCARNPELFARRWRALAHSWTFDALNELIGQHNDWYPIERSLPMDPRTGDYVPVNGRSYRRPVLGAAWVFEHFPPWPRSER